MNNGCVESLPRLASNLKRKREKKGTIINYVPQSEGKQCILLPLIRATNNCNVSLRNRGTERATFQRTSSRSHTRAHAYVPCRPNVRTWQRERLDGASNEGGRNLSSVYEKSPLKKFRVTRARMSRTHPRTKYAPPACWKLMT